MRSTSASTRCASGRGRRARRRPSASPTSRGPTSGCRAPAPSCPPHLRGSSVGACAPTGSRSTAGPRSARPSRRSARASTSSATTRSRPSPRCCAIAACSATTPLGSRRGSRRSKPTRAPRSAAPMRWPRRAGRRRLRCALAALGVGPGAEGRHSRVHVHRYRERRRCGRCAPRVRRSRRFVDTRSVRCRGAHHRAHRRDHSRAPGERGVRDGRDRDRRGVGGRAGRRGRGAGDRYDPSRAYGRHDRRARGLFAATDEDDHDG